MNFIILIAAFVVRMTFVIHVRKRKINYRVI